VMTMMTMMMATAMMMIATMIVTMLLMRKMKKIKIKTQMTMKIDYTTCAQLSPGLLGGGLQPLAFPTYRNSHWDSWRLSLGQSLRSTTN
jgi:hypothetical protein